MQVNPKLSRANCARCWTRPDRRPRREPVFNETLTRDRRARSRGDDAEVRRRQGRVPGGRTAISGWSSRSSAAPRATTRSRTRGPDARTRPRTQLSPTWANAKRPGVVLAAGPWESSCRSVAGHGARTRVRRPRLASRRGFRHGSSQPCPSTPHDRSSRSRTRSPDRASAQRAAAGRRACPGAPAPSPPRSRPPARPTLSAHASTGRPSTSWSTDEA
jgi:hypothetical protein